MVLPRVLVVGEGVEGEHLLVRGEEEVVGEGPHLLLEGEEGHHQLRLELWAFLSTKYNGMGMNIV